MSDTREIHDRLELEHRRLSSLLESLEGGTALQPDERGTELSVGGQHPADPADLGTETLERTKELTIARDLSVQVEEIERAQERLERGEYGTCQACGQPIPPQRLEAKPAARFCLHDQAFAERGV